MIMTSWVNMTFPRCIPWKIRILSTADEKSHENPMKNSKNFPQNLPVDGAPSRDCIGPVAMTREAWLNMVEI